ncbi:MAG: ThaI family type II restriction endonuclease [Thermoproteota archaeon]
MTVRRWIAEILEDKELVARIKERLPYLFQLAELEASRAGKVGMEVGTFREQILIALLIYKFGEENVNTNIPITAPEVDVEVLGFPISIRTVTGRSNIKVAWTVDAQKAKEFLRNYSPRCDILFVQINWEKNGKIYCIPLEVQQNVFGSMGRERYLRLPKLGTNPRGIEISKDALMKLITDENTQSIDVFWHRSEIKYKPYQRWIDYWKRDNLV